MTNVKLKLMFFLLNALLTADIVHARPYSDMNNTDIVIKFGNNNTFNLPIDPNSDTLIVAEETDEEIRETDRTSKSELEGLMNAEQGRDEDLSKKVMRDQTKTMDIPNGEGGNVEKQMNISSSLLDDIINSETDREDTITDILFRPESEFAEDMPKFEFLIAAKINESDFLNRSVSEIERDRNSSDVLKKVDYVELVEVAKPSKENRSALMMNITGHEVDNDLAPDTNLIAKQKGNTSPLQVNLSMPLLKGKECLQLKRLRTPYKMRIMLHISLPSCSQDILTPEIKKCHDKPVQVVQAQEHKAIQVCWMTHCRSRNVQTTIKTKNSMTSPLKTTVCTATSPFKVPQGKMRKLCLSATKRKLIFSEDKYESDESYTPSIAGSIAEYDSSPYKICSQSKITSDGSSSQEEYKKIEKVNLQSTFCFHKTVFHSEIKARSVQTC
ncbi:hypothetical protein HF086_002696 [Spodoptera exigua]|uniref:Uncharacterized protein n=1 Tax=Spodoptera exigua TaxID=7107 RepID=A0A922MAF1_SPOEX|nr:hypothetical protein HF086_002696 [Spodoptera exigua]